MLRIVIADDVDLVLKGIQSVLAGWSDGEIVGIYQSVQELLDGLAKQPVDVVILDDRIDPECAPLSVIQQVQNISPKAKIIVLGTVVDGMVVQEFFARGIQGYLYKSDTLAESLVSAIRAVIQGKLYLSPTAGAEHMAAMQEGRRRWQLDDEALTVLRLLADGSHVSQIAHRLSVSPYRIYAVRNKLRARFGAENNEAMISRAMVEGFLP
jgi:two-component system capsular synthesis response regulator RcsB